MTNKPNIEALSREFCELTGIEFAEYWWRPKCQGEVSPARVTFDEKCDTCMNHVEWKEMPDLSDAREVLKVMREKDGWLEYIEKRYACQDLIMFVLNRTGLLLKEAVEWMKGRERKDGQTANGSY